jgi:hypothetical protein
VFVEYFFSDMSHRPSKVNNEKKHCHGLLKEPNKAAKAIKAHKHSHRPLKQPTSHSTLFWKKIEHFSDADIQ